MIHAETRRRGDDPRLGGLRLHLGAAQRLERRNQRAALGDMSPDVGIERAALAGELAVLQSIAIAGRSAATARAMRNEDTLSPHAFPRVEN